MHRDFLYLFMGHMFSLLDRLDKVELKPIIILCLEQSQYEILAFNRGQLYDGKDNTGSLISPMYAEERYAIVKEEENPVPGLGIPDLFVTGDFYNGMGVVVNSSQYNFTISSRDIKAPKLELKYKNIYGLDPENTGYFSNEILKPKIVTELKERLGL